MNAQITAIANQKGGVGKTTSTVNLGVGLARQGKRVLLVDADPQGSLTVSLGIRDLDQLKNSLATLMLSEMADEPIDTERCLIHHKEGIALIPGNIELSGVELSLVNTMSRELVLRNVLNQFRSQYDYILIDCMPSLGLININALAAADSVIIPLQPNYLSTKGLNLLLRSISKVRKQINPRLRIEGILFTMVNGRTNNARSIILSLRTMLVDQIRVFQSEIPHSVRAAEAAEKGTSIFLHDMRSKVADAYTALTKEVISHGREANRSRTDSVR